jgi:predicted secreted hydrolase
MRSRIVALALAAGAVAPTGAGWVAAGPGFGWSFPRDHWSHPGYRNEWWYFNGIVEADDAPGRRFGYQLTFFRVGLLPQRPALDSSWAARDLLMGHAAVTDLASGEHRFAEVLYRAVPLLAGFGEPGEPALAWSRGPAGTSGRWEARVEGGAFRLSMEDREKGLSLALDLVTERPPVLEGPGGVSRKSAQDGFASLYYSLTRLSTRGALTLDGRTRRVHGESWMDREFGSSQLAPDQAGWDWFALQLRDGRDLMLYVLRGKDGVRRYQSGTIVDGAGRPTWLAAGDFVVRATGRWRSPATGADYPAGWELEVPSAHLSLRVEPAAADQENRGGRGPYYWEGAVRAFGPGDVPAGEGFVELVGYGVGNRPPI